MEHAMFADGRFAFELITVDDVSIFFKALTWRDVSTTLGYEIVRPYDNFDIVAIYVDGRRVSYATNRGLQNTLDTELALTRGNNHYIQFAVDPESNPNRIVEPEEILFNEGEEEEDFDDDPTTCGSLSSINDDYDDYDSHFDDL